MLETDFRHKSGPESPAVAALSVTPSDTVELTGFPRALWVGNAGDVAGKLRDDSTAVTFVGVQAGTLLPFAFKLVKSTGTTATSIVAVY